MVMLEMMWMLGIILNIISIVLWCNAYDIKKNERVLTWGRLLRIIIVMWIPVASLFMVAIDIALLSSEVSLNCYRVKYFGWLFRTPKFIKNFKTLMSKPVF